MELARLGKAPEIRGEGQPITAHQSAFQATSVFDKVNGPRPAMMMKHIVRSGFGSGYQSRMFRGEVYFSSSNFRRFSEISSSDGPVERECCVPQVNVGHRCCVTT